MESMESDNDDKLLQFFAQYDFASDEEDDEYDPHAERVGRDQDDDDDDDRSDIPAEEVQDLVDDCRAFVHRRPETINEDSAFAGGLQASGMHPMVPVAPFTASMPPLYQSSTARRSLTLPLGAKPTIPSGLARPAFSNADELRVMVARQMAINFQLMVQMLLMSDNRSEAFSSSYNGLLELRNYRDEARKRSALLQFDVGVNDTASEASAGLNEHAEADTAPHERLTRGLFKNKLRSSRCSSLFDLPGLENIESMFREIDHCKRAVGTQTLGDSGQSGVLEEHVRTIIGNARMKPWNAVIPHRNSVTALMDPHALSDPFSLTSRNYLTPAQELLLLRGLITFGEDFDAIQKQLLPFQSKEQLQFRYTNCADSEADNVFKRYKNLTRTMERNSRRWSSYEDAALVEGFKQYGAKWTTIKVAFLPHRSRKEMQKRWQVLKRRAVKAAQKKRNDHQYHPLGLAGIRQPSQGGVAPCGGEFEKEALSDSSDEEGDDGNEDEVGDSQSPGPRRVEQTASTARLLTAAGHPQASVSEQQLFRPVNDADVPGQTGKRLFNETSGAEDSLFRDMTSLGTLPEMPLQPQGHAPATAESVELSTPVKKARQGNDSPSTPPWERLLDGCSNWELSSPMLGLPHPQQREHQPHTPQGAGHKPERQESEHTNTQNSPAVPAPAILEHSDSFLTDVIERVSTRQF